MINADRVMNKAGAPCLDCKRVTFEMRRVCPWCAKARQAKIDAETVAYDDMHHERPERIDGYRIVGSKPFHRRDGQDVRAKQRRIEAEGMNTNLADG